MDNRVERVAESGSRVAECSATHGAEVSRGSVRLMEEDLRGLAGLIIWWRSDTYRGVRFCTDLKVSKRIVVDPLVDWEPLELMHVLG